MFGKLWFMTIIIIIFLNFHNRTYRLKINRVQIVYDRRFYRANVCICHYSIGIHSPKQFSPSPLHHQRFDGFTPLHR